MSFVGCFENPIRLAALYDDNLREQRTCLYPKQIKPLMSFASNPPIRRVAVCAANGTGKSRYLVSLAACWMAVNFKDSQTVITSASGRQLDRQTARYVKRMAEAMNRFHLEQFGGESIWEIRYRDLLFKPNNSAIDLFATDEGGKAEGWHPIVEGGEFAIIVDEGKSVHEDIYEVLYRCNGITRRLDVSSPAGCRGHFYEVCTRPELGWDVYHLGALECPHIRKEEISNIIEKYGIHDPLVRSSIFAEFTSAEESTVIRREILEESQKLFTDKITTGGLRAGLDLAAGGDENVLSVWDGNVQIGQECFRMKDTTSGAKLIIDNFRKYKLDASHIWADDGGVGRGIIDYLREQGWPVNRILNQSIPFDRTRYVNRGTELWFNFKRFIEEHQLKLIDDKILFSQLSNRYYRVRSSDGKLILEAKSEARAKGHPSPDRADAAVLAWATMQFPLNTIPTTETLSGGMTIEEVEAKLRNGTLFISPSRKPKGAEVYAQSTWVKAPDKIKSYG